MPKRILLLFNLLLAACGTTTKVVEPSRLHELKSGGAYAVAYDSRGRGAYVSALSDGNTIKVCAEPAPDASANLSAEAATTFALEANATYQAIAAALKSNYEGSEKATSTIVDVAQRTELVLVLREALYRLCELNLNQVLKDNEANAAFFEILRTARQLGQRDNVGRLVALLEKDLSPKTTEQIVQVIIALAIGETSRSLLTAASSEAAFQRVLNDILGLPGSQKLPDDGDTGFLPKEKSGEKKEEKPTEKKKPSEKKEEKPVEKKK